MLEQCTYRSAVQGLLHDKTQNGHHCKTSMLQFLGLHDLLTFGVLGKKAQGVETTVSKNVVLALLFLDLGIFQFCL